MLPELRVLPIESVFLHEEYELDRLLGISQKIKKEQKLKNPPIALQINEDKYLILDGAHRTSSLIKLNCKRIVVQVVDINQVSINAWAHHVPNDALLIDELKNNPGIELSAQKQVNSLLASIHFNDNVFYLYNKNSSLSNISEKVSRWKEIVNSYTDKYEFKRIHNNEVLPTEGITFKYPALDFNEIVRIVESNLLLPAGVTKFSLDCGRVLNLNIPLSFLIREDLDQDNWNELLKDWESSIRLYTDPIYLCEA
ncbi:hypothetical protein BHL35_00260 [Bacillus cereus]|nr:hypothetical protein BHL35_00260 [Bacillus cereus]